MGYGGTFEPCTDPDPGYRRYHASGGWVRDDADNGDVFANDWIVPITDWCTLYFGSGGGDSGGPSSENDTMVRPVESVLSMGSFAGTVVHGLVMSGQRSIVGRVVADAIDAPLEYEALTAPAGPTWSTDAVALFSATLGRAYLLDRNALGVPSAAIYDMLENQWFAANFDEVDSIGPIHAATFRPAERAAYLLEQSGDSFLLSRWFPERAQPAGPAFRPLVGLPAAWSGYNSYALVLGAEQDLLLVGMGHPTQPSRETLLARFVVAADGNLQFVGRVLLPIRLDAPPALTAQGIAISTPRSAPFLRTVQLAQLVLPDSNELPTIY